MPTRPTDIINIRVPPKPTPPKPGHRSSPTHELSRSTAPMPHHRPACHRRCRRSIRCHCRPTPGPLIGNGVDPMPPSRCRSSAAAAVRHPGSVDPPALSGSQEARLSRKRPCACGWRSTAGPGGRGRAGRECRSRLPRRRPPPHPQVWRYTAGDRGRRRDRLADGDHASVQARLSTGQGGAGDCAGPALSCRHGRPSPPCRPARRLARPARFLRQREPRACARHCRGDPGDDHHRHHFPRRFAGQHLASADSHLRRSSATEPHRRRNHRRPEEGPGEEDAYAKEKQRQFQKLEKQLGM